MRTQRPVSNAFAAVAAFGLVFAPVAQGRAQTDTATATANATVPPVSADANAAASPSGPVVEPPARVGRIASTNGTVSFHTADEDHWDPATLNYPLTNGDALWTEPNATAAVEISDSHITMASSTEFDIDQLDDHTLTVTQPQGETFWDLRDLVQGDAFTLRTPRGIVTITAAGQYDVFSGDTQSPTTVSVVSGAAQVNGDNLQLAVQTGQTATITGTGADGDPFKGTVGPLVHTAFMDLMLAAPNTVTDTQTSVGSGGATATATASVTVNAPSIVDRMPGGSSLTHYGTWQESPRYGEVWRPKVASDWVPYRDGHWAYIAPWGWTWIDDSAWGFAPFHYGRWVQDDGWAWAPTYYQPGYVTPVYAQPVYAPALVTFFGWGAPIAPLPAFGLGVGVGIGIGIGIGFGWGWGHVGWTPLGWGEPYHPWFNAGSNYIGSVNRYTTNNFYNNSVHNVTINNYSNAATGSTVVPTSAMVNSQRVSSVAQPFNASNLSSQAHLTGTAPTPTGATQGVTARQAQAQHLPNAEAAASRTSAPGPAIAGRTGSGIGTAAAGNATAANLRGTSGASRAGLTGQTAAAAATRPGAPSSASTRLGANSGAATPGTRTFAANNPAATVAGAHGAGTKGASAPGTGTHTTTAPATTPSSHAGLPNLRTAGEAPRAAGGAPGPAIAPRTGSLSSAPGATHGAPGPAITPHTNTANGLSDAHGAPGPAISHGTAAGSTGLPGLRDHATLASAESGRGAVNAATRPGQPSAGTSASHALGGNTAATHPHVSAPSTIHRSYSSTRSAPSSHYQTQRSPSYHNQPQAQSSRQYGRSYGTARAQEPGSRSPDTNYRQDQAYGRQDYQQQRAQSPGNGYRQDYGQGYGQGYGGRSGQYPYGGRNFGSQGYAGQRGGYGGYGNYTGRHGGGGGGGGGGRHPWVP